MHKTGEQEEIASQPVLFLGLCLVFLTCGAGGVFSILRSTSSGLGAGGLGFFIVLEQVHIGWFWRQGNIPSHHCLDPIVPRACGQFVVIRVDAFCATHLSNSSASTGVGIRIGVFALFSVLRRKSIRCLHFATGLPVVWSIGGLALGSIARTIVDVSNTTISESRHHPCAIRE